VSETAKQKKEREEAEAAAARDQEQAQLEQDRSEAHGEGQGSDATSSQGADTDPGGRDLNTAGAASSTAGGESPNHNATSFGRTEETFSAEKMVRGGVTPIPSYPEALPREEQEDNHREMALQAAKNVTGTSDGVSSVLPAVGGTTNMGLTTTEVLSRLDDGAVDAKGRLVGVYLDDLQAEQAQRHRERIEGAGQSQESKAAAARVRELASSPVTPAADIDKPRDEQGLVDPAKHTSPDGVDPNDPERRQRERVDAGSTAGR
jgi:hypothetical protein